MDNINNNDVNNKGEFSDYFGMNTSSNTDYKSDDFNNETVKDVNYETVDNKNNKDSKQDKYKKVNIKNKKGGKIAALIAGALVCAMLGGAVGATGVYLFAKDNNSSVGTAKKNITYDPPTFVSSTSKDGVLSATDAVKKISPAVVGVSVKSIVGRDLFNNTQEQDGIGSGFIINEEGYIVTNYHVIKGAQEVKAILKDGKEVNAKVINYDADQDIAVIKITDNIKVPGVAVLGDSDAIQAGEDVIAMGNPLGKEFSQTVTKGVVSSANRVVKSESGADIHYIQTDTAINPGNSGGPLINSKGEVVGINAAKKVGSGIEGIGFSIPINEVKGRLGVLSKPLLKMGIGIKDIDANIAKQYDLEEGIYISEVSNFSAAEKAGLKRGDVIIKFDGKRIKTSKELNDLKEKHKEGDVVNMVVVRDNKEVNIQIKLQS